jgi:hypothetical protein
MLDQIAGGLAGLILFLGQWLSPGAQQAELMISAVSRKAHCYAIECKLSMAWNEQLSDLVDAGIPLRMKVIARTDAGDSLVIQRTFTCNVAEYTYSYTDSIHVTGIDSVKRSAAYSQILVGMRNCIKWTLCISHQAKHCGIEAHMLPSRVPHLNRSIDVSSLCGFRKLSKNIVIGE